MVLARAPGVSPPARTERWPGQPRCALRVPASASNSEDESDSSEEPVPPPLWHQPRGYPPTFIPAAPDVLSIHDTEYVTWHVFEALAFATFTRLHSPRIIEANPGAADADVILIAFTMWRRQTADQRAAACDRVRQLQRRAAGLQLPHHIVPPPSP